MPLSPTAALPPASASPWLRLDIRLFRLLHAGRGPAALMGFARALARWSWLPLLALVAWVSLDHRLGPVLALLCLAWAGLVQLAGKRLARRWQAQRPFALGLCPNHLGHGGRAGFPSSHALVMGAVLGALLPHTASGAALAAMAALALGTGWARVHTGAHFPLDVIAGLAMGLAAGLGFGLLLA
ncbi:phosphatase PAP2 family protein [Hydrogenophaga sp. T2]|uniref:phosphatase PAP2 family protein n=1 Tax=Hydrogenophaga sp. T2 TaxID=3132823 RepID=UPI003CF565BA